MEEEQLNSILQTRKTFDDPRNFRPISLLCCIYKLLLDRISANIDVLPGRICTSQIFNLTQYIEGGYEIDLATGVELVDLSSAYDTVNHKLLLKKRYDITRDLKLVQIISTKQETFHGQH